MFSLKGGKGRGRASATRRPGLPHSFLVSRPEGESSGDLLSRQLRRVIGKGDSREREGCPSPRASKAAAGGDEQGHSISASRNLAPHAHDDARSLFGLRKRSCLVPRRFMVRKFYLGSALLFSHVVSFLFFPPKTRISPSV